MLIIIFAQFKITPPHCKVLISALAISYQGNNIIPLKLIDKKHCCPLMRPWEGAELSRFDRIGLKQGHKFPGCCEPVIPLTCDTDSSKRALKAVAGWANCLMASVLEISTLMLNGQTLTWTTYTMQMHLDMQQREFEQRLGC